MKTDILAKIAITTFLLALALPAAASDYTLGVFGNANEDDTINMQDVTYTELIILEYRDETELADAKYDDKINMQDVTQIELVILGKEKELTFMDVTGEAETIRKPVNRIITGWTDSTETMRALHAEGKIVGIDPWTQRQQIFYPEISKLPAVSHPFTPDYEAVMGLQPDAILPWVGRAYSTEQKEELEQKLPGVSVICLAFGFVSGETFKENVDKFGYIIDRRDEACEFIDFYDGTINRITEQTGDLSDDEKPRVYMESYREGSTYGAYRYTDLFDITGGTNIAAGLQGYEVEPEWVIEQNPNIIVIRKGGYGDYSGYEHDNPSELISVREEMLNRPELANVGAVKNGQVYAIDAGHLTGGPGHFMSAVYFAKWFHPGLFDDLDPDAIHQEYIDGFQRIDFNVCEQGVFVYPPLEEI